MKNNFFVRMMSCVLILIIASQGQLAFAVENTSILKNSAEPTILYEDETKRGEFEKHYICSDGSYVAATYPEQVCYLDEDGIWQEIDNSLKKVKGRFENKASDMKVSFAETTTDTEVVKLSNDNSDLSWNIAFPKAENSTYSFRKSVNNVINNSKIVCETSSSLLEENDVMMANNIESHVTYENIYSDTVDVQYTVLPGRVKENIILNEKTYLPSYTMNVSCEGLTAIINEENGVEFYDANGELQYEIQTPYMFDDIYELSYDIEIALEETEYGYTVTFYPDQEWLNSDERVYPITIDPTVKTGTAKANFSDTYIYQGDSASSSRCFEERLRVGIYNDKKYRVFWKTSKLPTIGNNANITSAYIVFKLPDATTTSRNFSIYQVKSSWTSESITWSKASDFSYTKLQSDVKRNTETDKVKFSGTKLTNVVKDWYKNGGNNGFCIRYTDESKTNPDYNLFYSSDNTTSTSYMPTLAVSYFNTLKIYQTENTYINDGSNNKPEDMKYNTKTQSQLITMNWISEIDFPRGIADRRTNWETLCRTTSTGDLQDVVLDMVGKFIQGAGDDYSNDDLTVAAKEHSSTKEYVDGVIAQIKSLLSTYNGDITKLAYTASNRTSNPLVKRMKDKKINQPVFNTASDKINGLTMCVNGLWGNEIIVETYSFDGTSYSCKLRFTLYDHFGLDTEDINKYGELVGFRDWYILQHFKNYSGAYKPFVTKMSFTKTFSGSI